MADLPFKYIRVKHDYGVMLIKANALTLHKAIRTAAPFLTVNYLLMFESYIFRSTDFDKLPDDRVGDLTLLESVDLPYHSLLCLLEALQDSSGESDLQYYNQFIAKLLQGIRDCTGNLLGKIVSCDPFANRYILEDELHVALVCPVIIRCVVGLLKDCGIRDEEVQNMVPTSLCHVQPDDDSITSCVVNATAKICDKYLELTDSEVAKMQKSMATHLMALVNDWTTQSVTSIRQTESDAFQAFMRKLSQNSQVSA